MAAQKGSRHVSSLTFRVRRIPADIKKTSLAEFLDLAVDGGLGGANNIHVGSLARSPDDWNTPAKQIATLSFAKIPPLLDYDSQTNWVIPGLGPDDYLLFDTDFLGFTPLNSSDDLPEYDCIAVSGLGSHPFGSWRQRSSTDAQQFMWLRDQLSKDFPKLRIMIYGYDTTLAGSRSSQDIDDLSRSFIAHMKANGRAEFTALPLIILAHSLGGILVKRSLFYLANSGDAEDFMLSKVRLAVFFGVPNIGMQNSHLRAMVLNQPNDILVQSLSIDNPYLKFLDDALCGTAVFRSLRLVSVYETQPSRTAELQPDGRWARTGPLELLVSRQSAVSRGSRDPHDIFHIDQDHSNLVKFSPDNMPYLTVRTVIRDALEPTQLTEISKLEMAGVGQSTNTVQAALQTGVRDQQSNSFESERRAIEDIVVLRSTLAFEEMDYRFDTIKPAHGATFDWVFSNQVSLMDWILTGSKAYWIRGKPGSGKSTLLKFLRDHHEFRQAITVHEFAVQQIDLWYFFNERGTYLQKTLGGLLRTILRGVIDECPMFASLVADVYYSKPKRQRGWSTDVLNEAFLAIVQQQQRDVKLLIFLDALDEYQGFPEVMCKWILSLLNASETGDGRTKIRICFSSRPWDSFLRAFEGYPGFTLHLHTIRDMRQYTRHRLATIIADKPTARFSTLMSETHDLIEVAVNMIAQRAEGVFIWVTFALDEIAATLDTNYFENLESIISCLPTQLEDFYLQTVMRIADSSRYRAFVILELVLRSPDLASAADILYASSCIEGSTYGECRALLETAKSRTMSERDMSRNLINLCNGLLEHVTIKANDTLNSSRQEVEHYVQFVHRTAKDFVGSPGFAQVIMGKAQATISANGYTFWLKYELARERAGVLKQRCLWLANMDEKNNGRPLETLLNSIPTDSFKKEDVPELEFPIRGPSPFIFGVMADLRLFVRKTITRQGNAGFRELREQNPHHAIAWSAIRRIRVNAPVFDLSLMSAMLLEHGFDIHGTSYGLKPFEILFDRSFRGFNGGGGSQASSEINQIARIYITKGHQNPDALMHQRDFEYGRRSGRLYPGTLSKKWSALHVASHQTIDMLLDCGANPNVLDTKGNTPLDICIGTEGNVYEIGDHRPPELAYTTTRLLLNHGALLTQRGRKILPTFLKIMRRTEHHDELVQRFSEMSSFETKFAVDDIYINDSSDDSEASSRKKVSKTIKRFESRARNLFTRFRAHPRMPHRG